MNTEIKAILTVIFDGVSLGKDFIGKNYASVIKDVIKILHDSPMAVVNIKQLEIDLKALSGSAEQADLIAFIESELSSLVQKAKENS